MLILISRGEDKWIHMDYNLDVKDGVDQTYSSI